MNYRNSLVVLIIVSGLNAASATHTLELGEFNDTNYEAQHVNLIHNITRNLETGIEWRTYNLRLRPTAAGRPAG